MAAKTSWYIDIERNYVTATVCICGQSVGDECVTVVSLVDVSAPATGEAVIRAYPRTCSSTLSFILRLLRVTM